MCIAEEFKRCSFMWNPGVWPYAMRCTLESGHDNQNRHTGPKGEVIEHVGMESKEQAED